MHGCWSQGEYGDYYPGVRRFQINIVFPQGSAHFVLVGDICPLLITEYVVAKNKITHSYPVLTVRLALYCFITIHVSRTQSKLVQGNPVGIGPLAVPMKVATRNEIFIRLVSNLATTGFKPETVSFDRLVPGIPVFRYRHRDRRGLPRLSVDHGPGSRNSVP